ncbi:uroporphyrinogen-III synthase [Roseovarius sp. 2305UL8-3]|uniref:uroporphyrinogen-III synthase n=1 Tax=Roseovarius conchicola TaxID=3121636 RepID=UPI003528EFF2
MPPTVLITRPEAAALRMADQLRVKWGCDVPIVISPLMQIAYLDEAPDLNGVDTLIFTSRHGVEGFVRLSGRRDIPCYAVGPATAAKAREAGFVTTDAGGDANALSRKVIADGITGCLHLRGEHAAGDVVGDLIAAGIKACDQVVYRQEALKLNDEAQALLRRDSPVILPLFSPRSAALFFENVDVTAPLLIAAISQSVANKVPKGVSEAVVVAQSPDGGAMQEALDTLRAHAIRLEGTNPAQ